MFGITKDTFEPWTPVDCIITIKMMSLMLTWDWAANLQREGLRQKHPDLSNLMEEIMPFTTDFLYDVVPIVDDSDLKKQGLYSDEPLVKRYRKSADIIKEASVPLDFDDLADFSANSKGKKQEK